MKTLFEQINCEDWSDTSFACCDLTPYSEGQISLAFLEAQQRLDALSYYRFGVCSYKVRVCSCSCVTECCCGINSFTLTPAHRGTLLEIIDWNIVDENNIIININSSLYRQYGNTIVLNEDYIYGLKQNLKVPYGEKNTSELTIRWGREIPILAKQAVADLACDILKRCTVEDCEIPANATGVSRNGIAYEVDLKVSKIRSVQDFINIYCFKSTWSGIIDPLNDTFTGV